MEKTNYLRVLVVGALLVLGSIALERTVLTELRETDQEMVARSARALETQQADLVLRRASWEQQQRNEREFLRRSRLTPEERWAELEYRINH